MQTSLAPAASIPVMPQPSYQSDFGLSLATSDPSALPGRGIPDVAALAGGNLRYNVPQPDMTMTPAVAIGAGTSAAAPMWAALVSQFNAIFQDQELPNLGYMNDLLYIAAAIAPGSFNDVTLGNNTSSFSLAVRIRRQQPTRPASCHHKPYRRPATDTRLVPAMI